MYDAWYRHWGCVQNNQGHIDNGELHKANEVGYLLYRPTENTTFEQRAATSALKKRMIDGGFTRSTHVPVLFEAAEEGDDIAKQILNEWAEDVAEGIAQIQVMYDPGLILVAVYLNKETISLNISSRKLHTIYQRLCLCTNTND